MRRQKIVYWVTTSLFSVWMASNAYAYLTAEEAKHLCIHFGFPDYFRIELAIAKLIGIIVLMVPFISGRLKEWAYVGFVITMISGFIAHLASGDPLRTSLSALLALVILLTSYVGYHHLRAVKLTGRWPAT